MDNDQMDDLTENSILQHEASPTVDAQMMQDRYTVEALTPMFHATLDNKSGISLFKSRT